MATAYVETTILSYLAAQPSRDLLVAAHQQATREWWAESAGCQELLISEAVLAEIERGDPEQARRRLELAAGLRVLGMREEVERLVAVYSQRLPLPESAQADLIHIAFAVWRMKWTIW